MLNVGMQEQAAAALADLAYNSSDMQDAIIDTTGVPSLLNFMKGTATSLLGQEHAARAIRNLCIKPDDGQIEHMIENQKAIVDCGTIVELVQLTKTGSQKAQELAAAGLSELASGAIVEREAKKSRHFKNNVKPEVVVYPPFASSTRPPAP